MAITEDRYYMMGIATDKSAADELSLLFRRNPNDPVDMDRINKFVIPLSDGAFGANVVVTSNVSNVIDQFNGDDYPQALLDAGKTEQEIDYLRTVLFVDYYDAYPNGLEELQPNAFDDFIASKGYQRA